MVLLKEFKKFALRGNVVDLAVGVVVGGAFSKIVTSLVNDLIMPLLGLVVGRVDLTALKIVVREATETAPALAVTYGAFLQNVLDFLVISFSIFMAIRTLNNLKRKEEEPVEEKPKVPVVVEPSAQEKLLMEIRDLLKENN
ncbi:MAG: large-conductance mechanosensitive channel protein MscL [Bacillota bacterium]|nr:large-conductance mechanosensitive channel protein MscL [Bacillota bacterium]HHU61400.1 large-conductance mechanosensitive channel protein MscL [Natronincola sp.]